MGGSGYATLFRYGTNEDNYIRSGVNGITVFGNHNGAEHMRLGPTGHLGLGTVSPTDGEGFGKCIDVRSATGGAIYFRDDGDTTNDVFVVGRDGANSYLISKSGNIIINSTNSERMRIASNGNTSVKNAKIFSTLLQTMPLLWVQVR